MEQEKLEIGDVVVLKSNSKIEFTIGSFSDNGNEAQCYYIHENQPRWEYLPIAILQKVKKADYTSIRF